MARVPSTSHYELVTILEEEPGWARAFLSLLAALGQVGHRAGPGG